MNPPQSTRLIGILPGEGIGPEVVDAALLQLEALESVRPLGVQRVPGGNIGLTAKGSRNGELTPDIDAFCQEIFNKGGVLFCGPGGGRFVYDLRRRFDLFCKLAPIKPFPVLHHATRFKPETLLNIDILVVRDNAGGVYQGSWRTLNQNGHGQVAEQCFSYSGEQVIRIVQAGADLAARRTNRMHVVIKEGGVPAISALWRDVAQHVAAQMSVRCSFLNADHAAYQLIQHPQQFDVLVTPNMIGDVLADLAAVFLGSRGLSFSGNFSDDGRAVYQTGHGAAHDLAGTNRANPVAQILSLAMLLRQSFQCEHEAALIEQAVEAVWKQGWRTDDLAELGCHCIGTREIASRVAEQITALGKGSASP
jgi:3-isopropylmalate dehydrogenase